MIDQNPIDLLLAADDCIVLFGQRTGHTDATAPELEAAIENIRTALTIVAGCAAMEERTEQSATMH